LAPGLPALLRLGPLAVLVCRVRPDLSPPEVIPPGAPACLPLLVRNWADLVKRARSKQLQPDEYNSGTFTISNLGMYGVESFDAILPPGGAAPHGCGTVPAGCLQWARESRSAAVSAVQEGGWAGPCA
jgi:hypothetical protein